MHQLANVLTAGIYSSVPFSRESDSNSKVSWILFLPTQFYSMIQKRIRVSALLAQLPSTPAADASSGPSLSYAAANVASIDSIQALRAQIAQQNAASSLAQQQVPPPFIIWSSSRLFNISNSSFYLYTIENPVVCVGRAAARCARDQ